MNGFRDLSKTLSVAAVLSGIAVGVCLAAKAPAAKKFSMEIKLFGETLVLEGEIESVEVVKGTPTDRVNRDLKRSWGHFGPPYTGRLLSHDLSEVI